MIEQYAGMRINFAGKFQDTRLAKRGALIMSDLLQSRNSSIRQSFSNKGKQKGVYRFLNNQNVTEEELIESCAERASLLCKGKHLLVVNDTTEINLQNNVGRIEFGSGAGLVGNNKDVGFFVHLGLTIDVETNQAIGYSSMQLWHRSLDKGSKESRKYLQLPVEEKESYKWLQCATESKAVLSEAASITLVGDRESDMYELFTDASDQGLHLVVRSRINRKTEEGKKLHEQLADATACGNHVVNVLGDVRKKTKSRTANLLIKYKQVTLLKPKNKKDDREQSIKITIVEAKEAGKSDGICWRILTTHPVTNYEDAIQIIEWYRKRWFIEEVFRLLKNKGYKIEDSQIETGWALRKLTIMLLHTILRVMQMLVAYGSSEEHDAKLSFTEDEIICLTKACKREEGKTKKLKNKHKQGTLKWATWIIARLGGWSGYESQRPPGPITLKNGLDKFNYMYEGWMLAKDVGTQ